MKKIIILFIIYASFTVTAKQIPTVTKELTGGYALPLENVIRIKDQTIGLKKSVNLMLPALSAEAGKLIVLRCRMVSYMPNMGGFHYNAQLDINGTSIGRRTSSGDERLIGRKPYFKLPTMENVFQVFSGADLAVVFSPDVNTGDRVTIDGQGSCFALNVTDMVRGVDGNVLTIRNKRKPSVTAKNHDLIVQQIEIGYLDRKYIPEKKNVVPERGHISTTCKNGSLQLSQGKAGGFTVTTASGVTILIETALSMNYEALSDLIAADTPEKSVKVKKIEIVQENATTFSMNAAWENVTLHRTVSLHDGLVYWDERWTNTTNRVIGVPFRHRFFLGNGVEGQIVLGGDRDTSELLSASMNPTLLIESKKKPGMALGVTAESDWLRLLISMRDIGGIGEIFSRTLALAPGKCVDFRFTITPVDDGGGYWSFINRVRERWGVNSYTVPRPVFWGYTSVSGEKSEQKCLAQSLSHLGPITLSMTPWKRLQSDAETVVSGNYPKLPDNAPRTPGKCPDLDINAFLTFAHRKNARDEFRRHVALITKTCPNVKVIQRMHPAMELVYKPLANRWPWSNEAIGTASGEIYESPNYSKAWLHGYTEKDWAVLYYVPRPGSMYLSALLESVSQSMDDGGSGIYCDEFSWALWGRAYSRYDYSRWDGLSADLDENSNVLRLKSDNAYVTESAQLQLAYAVLFRGGFFLGNSAPSLLSVNKLPVARFVEGGSGLSKMANIHLSMVPLVLGNFGDQTSRKGVFNAVKQCLARGCIYSPMAVNHLLKGADNFVCKLYPIRIRKIYANTVVGEQRLVTSQSGKFDWPGQATSVWIYEYDSEGNLIGNTKTTCSNDGDLQINVPKNGLVIAELIAGELKN